MLAFGTASLTAPSTWREAEEATFALVQDLLGGRLPCLDGCKAEDVRRASGTLPRSPCSCSILETGTHFPGSSAKHVRKALVPHGPRSLPSHGPAAGPILVGSTRSTIAGRSRLDWTSADSIRKRRILRCHASDRSVADRSCR